MARDDRFGFRPSSFGGRGARASLGRDWLPTRALGGVSTWCRGTPEAPLAPVGQRHPHVRRLLGAISLVALLASGGQAFAATAMWQGSDGGNWFVDANWAWSGQTPTSADEARVDSGGPIIVTGTTAQAANFLLGLGSTGTMTVNGTLETASATFGYSAGASGVLTVSAGSWTNASSLSIGGSGSGTLTLASGGTVHAGDTYLGAGIGGSSGTLAVAGASSFTTTGTLFVGYGGSTVTTGGSGTLSVTSGTVQSAAANIADGIAATGTATVSGSGSLWTNTGLLVVGGGGVGSLTVDAGGRVVTGSAEIGHGTTASGSSLVVSGSGSSFESTGAFFLGSNGDATLSVDTGATVTTGDTVIGRHSTSSATVDGAGSTWTAGALTIGGDRSDPTGTAGNGSLTVRAGAEVDSAAVMIGDAAGATGAATVTGTGSTWSAGASTIGVGTYGTGTLTIEGGATATSGRGIVGWNVGGAGTASVTGTGSAWTIANELYVGNEGNGTLSVTAGGRVASRDGYVGTIGGSTSSATIDGTGSIWDMSGAFVGGYSSGSTATVTVRDGGQLRAVQGTLGTLAGSHGTMTVTGSGSTWSAYDDGATAYAGYINVGLYGSGALSVTNGGAVNAVRLYIGNDVGSSGTVSVTGSGSRITTSDRLYVGAAGSGELTVSNGAVVSASRINIGYLGGSSGTLNIGAASGQAAAAPGTIDADAIFLGAGTAKIVLNHTSTAYEIRSAISGTGTIVVESGATTLSGANTYTGGTIITGGTLVGTAASFGTGTITNNAPLELNQATNASLANALAGAGTLTKTGAGTLELTGSSAGFTGATVLASGGLKVNGSLAGSVVTAQSGTVLSGSGTVGGVVAQSGATVSPGNSPGTLTVAGNYVQASGSVYNAEVVPGASTSDLISVTGTATIASGATLNVVKYGSGTFAPGARYTVLSAAGGVTGAYVVTGDTAISPFYGLTAVYDANNVYLDAAQTRSFAAAAGTPNQVAAASGLQSLAPSSALRLAVGGVSTDTAARAAFDALSGEIHASVKTALIEDGRFVRNAAIDRLRTAFGAVGAGSGASAGPVGAEGLTFWTTGYGAWGATAGDGNAARLSHDIGGVLIGADAPVFDGWRFGVMAGYGHANYSVTDRSSSGSSDNYSIGAYGGTAIGNLCLRLGTAYTWNDVATTRRAAFTGFSDTLTAKERIGLFQAFADVGQRFDFGAVAVEPFGGLAYVGLDAGGFGERGGAAALTASGGSTSVGFSTLGVRTSARFDIAGYAFTASGSLGWRHAFGSTTPSAALAFAGSAPFSVAGAPIARDAAVVEAGLSSTLGENLALGISYTGQFGSGLQSQGVRGNLSLKF